jgi:CBS domain-containing protein
MRVSDAMTREVRLANPGQSIRDAAKMMAEIDAGVMPVGEGDRLVGMITDRDIAIRAVAQGKGPDTPVREVMSAEKLLYCYEERLVGIVSLGDIAQSAGVRPAGNAMKGVSRP